MGTIPAAGHLLRYWGKAAPAGEVPAYHPVAFHGLDVAAVGWVLLEAQPRLLHALASTSGLPASRLRDWLTFLLSVHDLGKLADGFQGLRCDLLQALQHRVSDAPYHQRHDTLGFRLWAELLEARLQGAGTWRPAGAQAGDWKSLLVPWFSSVFGHHGRPPVGGQSPPQLSRQFPPQVLDDALALWAECARLLLPGGPPFAVEPFEQQEARFKATSWLVAGFATVADWLGSNRGWFPMRPEDMPLERYWHEQALPRARDAVAASGLAAAASMPERSLESLWPEIATPTPLQALVGGLDLADGPQLLVLEEITGGGKTEAALLLAHRLLARGEGSGIFVALPTMATANALHARVRKVFRHLFMSPPEPSLVLAHSKRDLFLELDRTPRDAAYDGRETTASQDCAAWLADSRKKALLAQVGVGTIDQALIGVLPLRHQGLRLCGLASKVLIVDEVHACDPYMERLLEALLTFHAAFGGSAVLLSATLPSRQKERLVRAFAVGTGHRPSWQASPEYPLLTHWAPTKSQQIYVPARRESARRVEVVSLRTRAEVRAHLESTLAIGGCACWIRNTVADAREAYEEWNAWLGPERVRLFHARFTVADRRALEEWVQSRFGRGSRDEERSGRLLIATQVVEQSLDLDFDAMVTDLAPIDRIVQRAGRLRRHGRPGRRGAAVLGVYGPQAAPEVDEAWYASTFKRGAFVYPDHGQLWRTAHWLERNGGFRMPEDARDLIEYVYAEDAVEETPEPLRAVSDRAEGKRKAEEALAKLNTLPLEQGYLPDDIVWPEDVRTPTRLGEDQVTVRLAREGPHGPGPWHDDLDRPWEQSEVQVRLKYLAEEVASPSLEALRGSMPDQGRYAKVVILKEEAGIWRGWALDLNQRRVAVVYGSQEGLVVERTESG